MIIGMERQNQIKQTLSQLGAIEYIKRILAASDRLKRTEIADWLCDHLVTEPIYSSHLQIINCVLLFLFILFFLQEFDIL